MRTGQALIYLIIVIVVFLLTMFIGSTNVENVYTCKVKHLQQQNLMSGTDGNIKTEVRYLVITDKETFVCESSIINGKFNNSDIFFRLEKDSTYNFKVVGYGKSIFTDYRNILEILK